MKKTIKEATSEDKQELLSVIENRAEVVEVRGKKIKVRWLHPAIGDWVSSLIQKEENDSTVIARCAALIRLNGFWKCHLFYWFLWRWYYYVRQYTAAELTPLFATAQKKTAQEDAVGYLNAMTYLIALDTTRKQMTKAEAERFLRELRTDKGGKSPKSTESTPAP